MLRDGVSSLLFMSQVEFVVLTNVWFACVASSEGKGSYGYAESGERRSKHGCARVEGATGSTVEVKLSVANRLHTAVVSAETVREVLIVSVKVSEELDLGRSHGQCLRVDSPRDTLSAWRDVQGAHVLVEELLINAAFAH